MDAVISSALFMPPRTPVRSPGCRSLRGSGAACRRVDHPSEFSRSLFVGTGRVPSVCTALTLPDSGTGMRRRSSVWRAQSTRYGRRIRGRWGVWLWRSARAPRLGRSHDGRDRWQGRPADCRSFSGFDAPSGRAHGSRCRGRSRSGFRRDRSGRAPPRDGSCTSRRRNLSRSRPPGVVGRPSRIRSSSSHPVLPGLYSVPVDASGRRLASCRPSSQVRRTSVGAR
jgi:hypothetical protein